MPAQLKTAFDRYQRLRKEVFGRALGVVFGDVGALNHEAHLGVDVLVGIAGKEFAAFNVVAALGGPMKVGVLPVVGDGVSGCATAAGARDEVALVPSGRRRCAGASSSYRLQCQPVGDRWR